MRTLFRLIKPLFVRQFSKVSRFPVRAVARFPDPNSKIGFSRNLSVAPLVGQCPKILQFPADSDFRVFREPGAVYVDKTSWINPLLSNLAKGDSIIFTRPRRWGKSLNLSMLHHFLSAKVDGLSTEGLFDGLKVAEDKAFMAEHQSQYYVIFINLKTIPMKSYSEFADHFRERILDSIDPFVDDLKKSDRIAPRSQKNLCKLLDGEGLLENSVKLITECLNQHYGGDSKGSSRVWVLVDEYDAPHNDSLALGEKKGPGDTDPIKEQVQAFMRAFFSASFKGNTALRNAVLTGILPIAQSDMFSGFNNAKVYTFLDLRYRGDCGFTEKEIEGLLATPAFPNRTEHMSPIKDWYDGYTTHSPTLYNPFSVMRHLEAVMAALPETKAPCRPYWVNSGNDGLLKKALFATSDTGVVLRAELLRLLQPELLKARPLETRIQNQYSFRDFGSKATFWGLLFHSGYLTTTDCPTPGKYHIELPNKEVIGGFTQLIESWLSDLDGFNPLYEGFMELLLLGEIKKFYDKVKGYLLTAFSFFDTGGGKKVKEQVYHVFMLGLVAHLHKDFIIKSNGEAGDGRYDIMIVPRPSNKKCKLALLMELKSVPPLKSKASLKEECKKGLKQIEDHKYYAELANYETPAHLYIALCFSGKNVEMDHKLNKPAEQLLGRPSSPGHEQDSKTPHRGTKHDRTSFFRASGEGEPGESKRQRADRSVPTQQDIAAQPPKSSGSTT